MHRRRNHANRKAMCALAAVSAAGMLVGAQSLPCNEQVDGDSCKFSNIQVDGDCPPVIIASIPAPQVEGAGEGYTTADPSYAYGSCHIMYYYWDEASEECKYYGEYNGDGRAQTASGNPCPSEPGPVR